LDQVHIVYQNELGTLLSLSKRTTWRSFANAQGRGICITWERSQILKYHRRKWTSCWN